MSTLRIRAAWQERKAASAMARNRDIAAELRLSEAELLASALGHETTMLRPTWLELIRATEQLEEIMVLARNDTAVIEKVGRVTNTLGEEHMGQVVSDAIDLRLFFSRWRYAFTLREETSRGERRSLQLFDHHGTAVLKIYDRSTSSSSYDALVHELGDAPSAWRPPAPVTPREPDAPDASIRVGALRQAWSAMTDTHAFHGLLRQFGVSRRQALRLAGPERAEPLRPNALQGVLEAAAKHELPIMIFVGNRGAIQIHTGAVRNVRPVDTWLNVLDPGFNLHVRANEVAEAWHVRKPSKAGEIHSLELYDHQGQEVCLLFGLRKDRPESAEWLARWRELLANLPRLAEDAPDMSLGR